MTTRHQAFAAGALLVVTITGCGISPQSTARSTPADRVPFELLDAQAPALVPDPTGTPRTICLVGDGRLKPVTRRLDPADSATELLRSLAGDVTDDEAEQGLRSALVGDVEIRSTDIERGNAVVDFRAAPEQAGQDRILAIGQIVCTLAHQPGIGQVSFTVAGAPVQVPRDDGSLTSDPVTIDDYSTLVAL